MRSGMSPNRGFQSAGVWNEGQVLFTGFADANGSESKS